MEMTKVKITQKLIKRTPLTASGQVVIRDDMPGLYLLVGKTRKTWMFKTDVYEPAPDPATGRRKLVGTRKVRVGDALVMLPDDARREARRIKDELKRGGNGAQKAGPPAPAVETTLRSAADRFLADRARLGRSPRTIGSYEADLRNYLAPFLDMPLASITGRMVADLHLEITNRVGPVTANGAMRTLRAVYNAAARLDEALPSIGPVTRAVEMNPEPPKTEIITDLKSWYGKVKQLTPIRRDLQLFILFTGMRKTAACEACLEHLDLDTGFLFVPKPKGGERRAFYLPLSDHLVGLLKARVANDAADFGARSPWLFPSILSASGHVEEPKEQGLPGPHALRRTFATVAAEAGLSPADIGLLLNHAIPGVTGRYIVTSALGHSLRAMSNRVAARLLERIAGG